MSSTYLLDTHALIWALSEPELLGDSARATIESAEKTLVVSAVSAWEIATKVRLGRLPRGEMLVAGFARNVSRLRAQEAPITAEHALLAGGLDWDHQDPFDRMLAAQAMLEGWTLVTRDKAFASLTGIATLW